MKRLIFAAWVALLAGMGAAQAQSVGQCPTQSSSVSGSSYTLKSTDNCLWVFLTNSGPITVTLPAASLVFSPGGYETVLYPLNDGTVTLVAQADANRGLARYVNGVTSLTVAAGQPISLRIGQDSNWYAVASLLTTIVNPTITGGTITNSAINGGTIANLSAPLVGGSGGTGVNNGSNTITVGGNLVTNGAVTIGALSTTNGLLYSPSAGNISPLATGNNGVLVTNGSGAPSISSTLPSGLTIPSPTISGSFSAPGLVTSTDLARSLGSFGAVCDGVTNDTTALAAAATWSNSNGIPVFGPGGQTCLYANNSPLTFTKSGTGILGQNGVLTIKGTVAAGDIIKFDGSGQPGAVGLGYVLKNIAVDSTVAKTSGYGVHFYDAGNVAVDGLYLGSNDSPSNLYAGVYWENSGGSSMSRYYVSLHSATPSEAVTIGGTLTIGDGLRLAVMLGSTGATTTVTYTTIGGDTPTSEATGLAAAVNANSTLTGAGLHATSSSNVVTITYTSPISVSYGRSITGTGTETMTLSAPECLAVASGIGNADLFISNSALGGNCGQQSVHMAGGFGGLLIAPSTDIIGTGVVSGIVVDEAYYSVAQAGALWFYGYIDQVTGDFVLVNAAPHGMTSLNFVSGSIATTHGSGTSNGIHVVFCGCVFQVGSGMQIVGLHNDGIKIEDLNTSSSFSAGATIANNAGYGIDFTSVFGGTSYPAISSGILWSIGNPAEPNVLGNLHDAAQIGDVESLSVLRGSATSLTNNTGKSIGSVSLFPGLWQCHGQVGLTGGTTTTVGQYSASIDTTAGAIGPTQASWASGMAFNNTPFNYGDIAVSTMPVVIDLRSTVGSAVVENLNTDVGFGADTASAYGSLVCTKVN